MTFRRFARPPRSLTNAKLDNVALVPASLLPFKREWQQVANELPAGGVLICVPDQEDKRRETFIAVARQLRDKGMRVRAVPAERFRLAKSWNTNSLERR